MKPTSVFDLPLQQTIHTVNGRNHVFMEVHPIGFLLEKIIAKQSPVQLPQPGAIWIETGSGSLAIDLDEYPVNDHMLICLSQGQMISVSVNSDIRGYYLSFSPEFLLMAEGQAKESLLDALYQKKFSPVAFITDDKQTEITEVVKMLYKEFESYGLRRLPILLGLVKVFLVYLTEHLNASENDHQNERDADMGRKFMELVKKHFITKKTVAEYAGELCITPNYLNRIIKKISGYTASYHIQQHIMLEAKRQAMYSQLSMKEVAYFLGFNDYAHFSKFFKNNSGMNFTSFKNQIRNRA